MIDIHKHSGSASGTDNPNSAYSCFAPYYDHYMRHVNYDAWTDKILKLFETHSPLPLKDVLELACGTANISERLVRKGYNVTASDCSAEMLQIASHKEFKPNLYQADLTDELPARTYDMIFLAFDSLNYLLNQDRILRLFLNCARALRKDGVLIFDISTLKNSLDNFSNLLNIEDTEKATIIQQADFDLHRRIQLTTFTIFQKQDDCYIRFDEKHQQYVYTVTELVNLLSETQFDCVGLYSLAGTKNLVKIKHKKLDYSYNRLFFVCRQGNETGSQRSL